MTKIDHTLVINRPVEDVFAYHDDPDNMPKWETAILVYEQTSEGPIGVGTTFREVRKLMGRRLESASQITAYKVNQTYAIKTTSGPISYEATMTFESVDGSTRIKVVAELEPGGIFKLVEPIFRRVVQKQIEGHLSNLKDLMEAGAGAGDTDVGFKGMQTQ